MAANTIASQSFTFRDAKGMIGKTRIHVFWDIAAAADAAGVANNVKGALTALTNATIQLSTGVLGEVFAPAYGLTATYENAEDKARLTYLMADGSLSHIDIPAPLSAIFLADGQTVNTANTLVAGLTTQLTTAVVDAIASSRGGSAFLRLLGGQRQRRKTQRKMSIYTLSGNLNQPAE
jgi:hypothetical protein